MIMVDVPFPYNTDTWLTDAYKRGWNHGRGLACHNVPKIGEELHHDTMGRVTVDAENIREVHAELTESNSRHYSPYEFDSYSLETNDVDSQEYQAFEDGVYASIRADLETYTDDDYGIPGCSSRTASA